MGLAEGHSRPSSLALYEALFLLEPIPQATLVFDPRALGLTQVKAAGLVQTSGLLLPEKT